MPQISIVDITCNGYAGDALINNVLLLSDEETRDGSYRISIGDVCPDVVAHAWTLNGEFIHPSPE